MKQKHDLHVRIVSLPQPEGKPFKQLDNRQSSNETLGAIIKQQTQPIQEEPMEKRAVIVHAPTFNTKASGGTKVLVAKIRLEHAVDGDPVRILTDIERHGEGRVEYVENEHIECEIPKGVDQIEVRSDNDAPTFEPRMFPINDVMTEATDVTFVERPVIDEAAAAEAAEGDPFSSAFASQIPEVEDETEVVHADGEFRQMPKTPAITAFQARAIDLPKTNPLPMMPSPTNKLADSDADAEGFSIPVNTGDYEPLPETKPSALAPDEVKEPTMSVAKAAKVVASLKKRREDGEELSIHELHNLEAAQAVLKKQPSEALAQEAELVSTPPTSPPLLDFSDVDVNPEASTLPGFAFKKAGETPPLAKKEEQATIATEQKKEKWVDDLEAQFSDSAPNTNNSPPAPRFDQPTTKEKARIDEQVRMKLFDTEKTNNMLHKQAETTTPPPITNTPKPDPKKEEPTQVIRETRKHDFEQTKGLLGWTAIVSVGVLLLVGGFLGLKSAAGPISRGATQVAASVTDWPSQLIAWWNTPDEQEAPKAPPTVLPPIATQPTPPPAPTAPAPTPTTPTPPTKVAQTTPAGCVPHVFGTGADAHTIRIKETGQVIFDCVSENGTTTYKLMKRSAN